MELLCIISTVQLELFATAPKGIQIKSKYIRLSAKYSKNTIQVLLVKYLLFRYSLATISDLYKNTRDLLPFSFTNPLGWVERTSSYLKIENNKIEKIELEKIEKYYSTTKLHFYNTLLFFKRLIFVELQAMTPSRFSLHNTT